MINLKIKTNGTVRNLTLPYPGQSIPDIIEKNSVVTVSEVTEPESLKYMEGHEWNIDEINFLAKRMESFDKREKRQFDAIASQLKPSTGQDLINQTFNLSRYTLISDFSSLTEIGKTHVINRKQAMSFHEMASTDFAKIGKDLIESGKGIPAAYGVMFINEDIAGQHVRGKYNFDADNDIVHISFYVNSPSSPRNGASLYFRIDGVLPKNKTTTGGSSTAITQDDPDYKPYRGYLTYTNGEVNKHGQPFPDLMDFNDDGEINWLDVAIQKELSHNPDWLDMPASKGAAAALAVITALLGAAGGVVGGALGGPLGSLLGSAAQAASSAAEGAFSGLADGISGSEQKEDLGPYIRRDPDGDLEVNDPVTGEKRVYVANGNGTYTNPLTGATYTPDELKSSLDSRAENAHLIRQDDAFAKAAIEEQRAANQEKSWIAKQAEAENAAERAREAAEAEHEAYKEETK